MPPVLSHKWVPPSIIKHLEKLGEKHKVRKGYTLYQCLSRLPGQGVGMRIYKKSWERTGLLVNSMQGIYWHVVKTEFNGLPVEQEGSVKRAWGIKYINGMQATPPHTIVQIEDPDEIWRVCDDMPPGHSSNSFYLSGHLKSLEAPDFGTDVATASVQDELSSAPTLNRTTQ